MLCSVCSCQQLTLCREPPCVLDWWTLTYTGQLTFGRWMTCQYIQIKSMLAFSFARSVNLSGDAFLSVEEHAFARTGLGRTRTDQKRTRTACSHIKERLVDPGLYQSHYTLGFWLTILRMIQYVFPSSNAPYFLMRCDHNGTIHDRTDNLSGIHARHGSKLLSEFFQALLESPN